MHGMHEKELLGDFLGSDPVRGNQAQQSLIELGVESLDVVLTRFGSIRRSRQIRRRLGEIFSRFGDAAVTRLIPILASNNWQKMVDATYCFDGLSSDTAGNAIGKLLHSSSIDVDRCAIAALGYANARGWRGRIMEEAGEPETYSWEKLSPYSLHAFVRMASKPSDLSVPYQDLGWIENLHRVSNFTLVQDNFSEITKNWFLDFTPSTADGLMKNWGNHEQPIFRQLAAEALMRLRLERTVEFLGAKLDERSEDPKVLGSCAQALGEIDSANAASRLQYAYENADNLIPSLAINVARVLWRIEEKEFIKKIVPLLLSNSNVETRATTLHSIGLLGQQYEAEILKGLNSTEFIERCGAALGYARLAGQDAKKKLRQVHKESSNNWEKIITLTALIHSGDFEKAKELHVALCEESNSEDLALLWYQWKREILLAFLVGGSKDEAHAWSKEMNVDLEACLPYLSFMESFPETVTDHGQIALSSRTETSGVDFSAHISQKPDSLRSHAVVLIHGIRTQAEWQQRAKVILEQANNEIVVYPTRYEFFDIIRFLLPLGWIRRRPVDRIASLIRDVQKKQHIKNVSVIAHSFGSFIISKILEDHTDIEFHRVILCGAVMEDGFKWERYSDRIGGKEEIEYAVVNDCGMRDIWPVFAKSVTWGYGSSGRFGFGHPRVADRYHNGRHSDFFNENFVKKFWAPFLTSSEIVRGEIERPTESWLISLLTVFKIRNLILFYLLLVVIYFGLLYFP